MKLTPIPGEPGVYEPTITHIPANDWATIGARLERCNNFNVESHGHPAVWMCRVMLDDGRYGHSECASSPIEALTAALDAAEGVSDERRTFQLRAVQHRRRSR